VKEVRLTREGDEEVFKIPELKRKTRSEENSQAIKSVIKYRKPTSSRG